MESQDFAPSMSTLILSMASAAAMALGLAPDPQSQQTSKDLRKAQFHIDMLLLIKDKTQNNLSSEEDRFLTEVISDLQMKFIQAKE